MKKIIYSILVATLTICMIFPSTVSANTNEKNNITITQETLKNHLYDFVEKNPSRTVGTDGEKQAAQYLAEKFFDYKLESYFGDTIDFEEDKSTQINQYYNLINGKDHKGNSIKTNNVVGYKPSQNGSNDTVVIGAHFDNVYSFMIDNEEIKSHGAYDNGTGIAVLLSIAQALENQTFDFNIIFVAFTSEETGLYGSEEFIVSMLSKRKPHFDNLLLMYNLDVIGAGDHLYLYTDEVQTGHGKFIQNVAKNLGIEFSSPPKDKKIMLFKSYFYNLPYTHAGMMSDHANFFNQNKNIAFFFTMNWDSFIKNGISESERYAAIMHTRNDNLQTLENNYGSTYPKFMSDVANVIVGCLMQNGDFVVAMNDSYENKINYNFWTNDLWAALIAVGIILLFAGFIVFMYYKYKKKSVPIDSNLQNGGSKNIINVTIEKEDDFIFGKELDGNKKDENGLDDPFGL